MSHIRVPVYEEAAPEARTILDAIKKNLGFIPNVTRLLSLSPIALQAFAGLQGTLAKGLDLRTRNAVALAVSQANECGYCMAAHSFASSNFGKESSDEIALNLQGKSTDPKKGAAATFGKTLIETHGHVSDDDLAAIRAAGYTDGQIIEMIALTAQVLMTNFVNNVAGTEIDIPSITASAA